MPPLPVTLQISADKDGDDWTDLTTVKTESLRMGGQAGPAGEVGTGFGFDFEDAEAAFELPARRRVRLLVGELGSGDFLLAQGRVTDKTIARRSPPVGDVRGFDTNISDANAHLQGIPVHRWVRPAETDVARITALADEFLSGDPRPSTNLTQAFLSSSNPIDLPAKTYDTTNPAGVVADVCALTRKLFFVTTDDDIFYDADDSTAFAADLSVTDVNPDPSFGVWEFSPLKGVSATQDGTEFYSGLRLMWGELGDDSVHDSDSGAEAGHDFWEEVVFGNSRTQTDALIELDAILAGRKLEELRISFALLLTDAELLLLKYGQTFSFRSAATGILSPVTVRCSRLTWSLVGMRDDMNLWRADIEAGFPKKLAPRLSRGTRRTAGQPVEPVGGNNLYTVCHPSSFHLGVWEVMTDPGVLADLLIPSSASGTSITIGPATGSTSAVPGWLGAGTYTVTDGAFPLGTDSFGILSGHIVTPAGPGWTAITAFLRFGMAGSSSSIVEFSVDDAGSGYDGDGGMLPPNTAFYFKLKVGITESHLKIWEVGDPEPSLYGTGDWGGVGTPPDELFVQWEWSDTSAPYDPPEALTVDQLTWCYTSQYPTAFAGQTYGPVFIGVADGATSAFALPDYPGSGYTPGTLMVFVDGVWQPVSETDTTPPGQFDFGVNPDEDDEIYATWRVPS